MDNKYRRFSWIAVIVLTVSMVLSLIFTAVDSVKNTEADREKELRSEAQLVENAVVNSFIRPITVAKAMSEDVNLKAALKKAESDPTGAENEIQDYLLSLKNGLGYKMMFAVCDGSGAYYTCDGITSYIDKNYEGNSAWYGEFLQSGKDMDLDVDIEESADWALSVFVNQFVFDENKNILGVCGTGVEMTQLQSLCELYEKIYDIRIDVTDETGLIQIDTDEEKIEKDSISLPDIENISDGEFYYQKTDDGDRVITYMDDLDMYLVITDEQSPVYNVISDIKLPAICFIIGIIAAAILMMIAEKTYKKTYKNTL